MQEAGQGSADPARHNQDRLTGAGFLNGVREMLNRLTSRPVLGLTTSAAALLIGFGVIYPLVKSPTGVPVAIEAEAPVKPAPAEPAPVAEPVAPDPAPSPPAADADRVLSDAPEAATSYLVAPAPKAMERQRALGAPAPLAATRSEGAAPMGVVADTAMPEMDALSGMPEENTETFANAAPNPVKVTAEEPVSTFSIDVDTASYGVIRQSLTMGSLPPPEAVRVEEVVNYFPYGYPAPGAEDAPFRSTVTVMPTPWNAGTRLVHVALQGRLPAIEDRPPLNLVFLIDTSGSMEDPAKLPLLKQSFALLVNQLRPEDEVAIVAYAGSAGTVLEPTPARDAGRILAALDNLAAGGSTAGAEGLELAYRVAEGMAGDGEVSRVILATDGDFNVGVSDPEGLTAYVGKKRDAGTYLSVLGFGRGNLDDATMQALAQNGNGQAAYIDTAQEARKVLVDQLTGALFPIADDVKIQVEWNPAEVAEYRLIGYETRALAREDFNNDRVDAGEIGAGHSVTAIYEITAPGSAALRNDPLRYGTAEPPLATSDELGFLRLRYKAPGESESRLIETPILPGTDEAGTEARFAVAMAGFGQLLRGSVYLGDWGWDQAIELALSARGDDPFGYRIEAVNLMRMAKALDAR
ncbi:vWA domain-containing protein [Aliigemmobacter aestuarii]